MNFVNFPSGGHNLIKVKSTIYQGDYIKFFYVTIWFLRRIFIIFLKHTIFILFYYLPIKNVIYIRMLCACKIGIVVEKKTKNWKFNNSVIDNRQQILIRKPHLSILTIRRKEHKWKRQPIVLANLIVILHPIN